MKKVGKKIIVISNIVTTLGILITFLLNVMYDIFKLNQFEIFSFAHSFLPYLILLCFLTNFIFLLTIISMNSKEEGKRKVNINCQ